jgi:DNA-directed RNA polymerase subunit RPC12/RpoP
MKCPHCGTEVKSNYKYDNKIVCFKCGFIQYIKVKPKVIPKDESTKPASNDKTGISEARFA